MILVTSSFSKRSVFKMVSVYIKKAKPVFSNFSNLKSDFKKLCLHDGLVWMVGLTVEKKLFLNFSSAV